MASHIDKQILSTAIVEFARVGYFAAATKEIAKLADVTESSLFRLFNSKEDLFEAAVKSAIALVQPRAVEIEFILSHTRGAQGIRVATRRYCQIMDASFVRLRAFTVLERPGPLANCFQTCEASFVHEFEKAIEADVKAKLFHDDIDPASLVHQLLGYCSHVRIFGNVRSEKTYRAAVDSFVEILLKAIAKPVPKPRRTRK